MKKIFLKEKSAEFKNFIVKKMLPVLIISISFNNAVYPLQNFHTHENIEQLVNTDNPLPDDYSAPNLIEIAYYKIPAYSSKLKLQDEAAYYLSAMIAGMKKNDIKNVKVLNGYKKDTSEKLLYSSGSKNYITAPNADEYQTGLSVDLSTTGTLSKNFKQSSAYKWLEENAHNYGYILRYPEDKTNITNHEYEPWHYRYVGIPLATYMNEYEMCLEEFYKHTPPPFWDETDEKIKTYLYAMYDKINIIHEDNSFRGSEKISYRELYKWLDEYYEYKMKNTGSEIPDLMTKLYYKALILGNTITLNDLEAQEKADNEINRENLVLSLSHLLDSYEKSSDFNFTDIPEENEKLLKVTNKMYNLGIIRGYENHTFHPESTATKSEALVLIYDVIRLL